MENSFHQPAMLREILELLELKPGEIVLDATLGGAGHSVEFLRRITGDDCKGFLIGIDQDEEALQIANQRLDAYDNKKLIHDNFVNFKELMADMKISGINKIFFDLGVSMHQLKSNRGFSFTKPEARFDSRMDSSQGFDAGDFLNKAPLAEIEAAFQAVDAPLARKVAGLVVDARKIKAFNSMGDFLRLLNAALPQALKRHKTHYSTQYLLGLRIVVNQELKVLSGALPQAVEFLSPGGRIAVLSYHSAEDRIVKNIFKHYTGKCICMQQHCSCMPVKTLKLLTPKPVLPSIEEIKHNPAARSAKLRAAEKL
jgi:16S rRNA (cytosine1402-N4)-methyltransferase